MMIRLVREKLLKTRKDHNCFGCCEKIPAGSETHTETYAEDEDIYTLYFCEVCWMFMNENRDLCEDSDGFIREGWIGDARREEV